MGMTDDLMNSVEYSTSAPNVWLTHIEAVVLDKCPELPRLTSTKELDTKIAGPNDVSIDSFGRTQKRVLYQDEQLPAIQEFKFKT